MPDVHDLTETLRVIRYPTGALELQRLKKIASVFVLTEDEQARVIEFLIPRRGDPVAEYLKRWRDKFEKSHGYYFALDQVLDDYRLHADTGRPLHEDVAEGDEGP